MRATGEIRVLVTGAAGILGRNVLTALAARPGRERGGVMSYVFMTIGKCSVSFRYPIVAA